MRDNRRQCIDFAYACRQQYRANSYKGERDYATSMDSSEAAENLRYTVVKSEHRREVATHRDDQTATDEDDLPLVRGFRSVKQESDAVSLARPRKKRRDRPKKSEIDTRDIVPLRKESPDLDLAGTRRQLSAQTRIDPPAHSTAAAYQWYPSEDEVVPPRKRATSTHLGKARKKRRLLPCNRRTATGGALRRSDMLHMDQDRKQNRSPVNHVPRRKERPRCPIVLEPESHEDQVLDGGDKYGQPIAAAASTSSFESGMRQRPEESRESSVQGGMRPCQNGIHAKIKSEPFVSQPKMRPNGKRLAPAVDPKEPYPDVKSEFGGIPPNAVGDLLQVWEFITAFSKTLRLSPFKLFHLQQAIMYPERCHLLDSILLRLVQAIVSDEGLVFELSIPDSVVKGLRGKNTKNDVNIVLQELPNILSFESDEVDDHFLQLTVEKLRQASRKLAFYKTIGPDGKLRILRELIDYATMTDSLRACVTDSMDHAEVEKKKAREENAAKRKKLDQQLRDLRTELLEYKLKNGLIDNTPPGETEKSAGGESKENGVKSESASINTDREEVLSRKEKMAALKKEKLEMEERREKERGAEAIAARMDKVRVNLKSLKNVRLRNRHKDDDGADASGNALTTTLADQYQDPVRTFPLGTDREERCYWFFQGSGRIWIENTKTGEWCTLNSVDGVNNLLKWLSPFRKQERMLKKKIRQRLGEVELEITQELKSMEQAEIEAREAADALPEFEPRTTRAGKRRASLEAKQRKKSKTVTTFLDYRNAGR